ncbi:MAG: PatB family C-S lyase [Pseudomonadales bacterium]|jgi:cystathionine beta-lyase|nr:PatB family C-S lyase [Pseudomonadales bacterium]MDP6472010.1 PatB family C-S lyase [Pseudomonadales bacterium]MDP6826717.1 PatB family C-S lyase [Pseudomonadales bacterium]MDP6972651.1 PatB family C-S lyase [Pseudomonadales bacterium]
MQKYSSMPTYDFDRYIDRHGTSAAKWIKYSNDILPFWVADMDFAVPDFVLNAIRDRVDHGILGYSRTPPALDEAFLGWLRREYGWQVPEQWLAWIPGVVPGLNLAALACATPGGAILMNTPVYYPFLSVPETARQTAIHAPLVLDGGRWAIDFERMASLVTPETNLLLACNPQNPTGRAYTTSELEQLATFVLEHDLVICSDEIHSSIVIEEHCSHTPIVALVPELEPRSVSLYAASKSYNVPGLSCAVAVIPNAGLRRRFQQARAGLVGGISPLAYAAAQAAFADEGPYLSELCTYLRANHDALKTVVGNRMTNVEATYLAWIDVRDLGLENPEAYFTGHGLGLSIGEQFAGPGFIRFNFACPRITLDTGLERLERALRGA